MLSNIRFTLGEKSARIPINESESLCNKEKEIRVILQYPMKQCVFFSSNKLLDKERCLYHQIKDSMAIEVKVIFHITIEYNKMRQKVEYYSSSFVSFFIEQVINQLQLPGKASDYVLSDKNNIQIPNNYEIPYDGFSEDILFLKNTDDIDTTVVVKPSSYQVRVVLHESENKDYTIHCCSRSRISDIIESYIREKIKGGVAHDYSLYVNEQKLNDYATIEDCHFSSNSIIQAVLKPAPRLSVVITMESRSQFRKGYQFSEKTSVFQILDTYLTDLRVKEEHSRYCLVYKDFMLSKKDKLKDIVSGNTVHFVCYFVPLFKSPLQNPILPRNGLILGCLSGL